jgi:hypothetical protein
MSGHKELRLGLQPKLQISASGLTCGLPKLASPLGDFVAADFFLVPTMIFLICYCAHARSHSFSPGAS